MRVTEQSGAAPHQPRFARREGSQCGLLGPPGRARDTTTTCGYPLHDFEAAAAADERDMVVARRSAGGQRAPRNAAIGGPGANTARDR